MGFVKYFISFLGLVFCLTLQAHDGQQLSTHIHAEAKPLIDKYTTSLPFIEKGLIATKKEITATISTSTASISKVSQFSENRNGQCAKGFMYIFSLLGFFLCLGYFVNQTNYEEQS